MTTGATITEVLNIFFRWLHVLFGIIWVGLLYFFNFINAYFSKTLDAPTKEKVFPELMTRALFFFRWAAMATFLFGLILLYINYLGPDHVASLNSIRGEWIILGGGLGTIMWFNVWFIIWPSQKRIIEGIKTRTPVHSAFLARSTMASKINVYLSIPLIFAMLAASGHFIHGSWYWVVGVILIGFFIASQLYVLAEKIGLKN
jgi:uncharacterized membrane protein